jgi:uncharacterized protein DUF3551
MKQLLTTVAAPATAVMFTLAIAAMSSTAASATEWEYCDRDTAYMLQCQFANMEQCKATGFPGDCERDPFLANLASHRNAYAYQPKHSKKRKAI